MRELAVKNDVPFKELPENDPRIRLPEELLPIAEKLMDFATGKKLYYWIDICRGRMLFQRHVHLSDNWNAAKGLNNSDLDVLFINRPTDNYQRTDHPNE